LLNAQDRAHAKYLSQHPKNIFFIILWTICGRFS